MITAEEFPRRDTEFEDQTVRSVDSRGEDGWGITMGNGWSFWVPSTSPIPPTAGMHVRMYGKGIGYDVRGLFLDGRKVFYRTDAEQRQKWKDEKRAEEEKRQGELDATRDDRDARWAKLPDFFRARFTRFNEHAANFRRDYEPYELFVCEQAVEIANGLRVENAGDTEAERDKAYVPIFNRFRELPFEEQRKAVPKMEDGHSGNTFGCAAFLARLYLTNAPLVAKAHGAMVPLVGCEAYGCSHDDKPSPKQAKAKAAGLRKYKRAVGKVMEAKSPTTKE